MRTLEYAILGIPVRFESDCEDVLNVAEEAFGVWSGLEPRDRQTEEPLVARFMLGGGHEHDRDEHGRYRVRHFCPDADRVIASSAGSFGVSDPTRREAVAVVTRELVSDREHFRETFLEALTFALVSAFDRHPVHAACVARNGHALLLAGPSGAGKSSLAMVAHQDGLRVLGDDHVWIQTAPASRVWGAPRHIRLVSNEPTRDPRGKTVVRLNQDGADAMSYRADAATVCVLARGAKASLDRIDAACVAHALSARVDPGFGRFPKRHGAVVERLSSGGGWKLTLSNNPDDALPFLQTMLDS